MAEALGKFEHEILELSPQEFARWLAFFKLREEEDKAKARKIKAKKR